MKENNSPKSTITSPEKDPWSMFWSSTADFEQILAFEQILVH